MYITKFLESLDSNIESTLIVEGCQNTWSLRNFNVQCSVTSAKEDMSIDKDSLGLGCTQWPRDRSQIQT